MLENPFHHFFQNSNIGTMVFHKNMEEEIFAPPKLTITLPHTSETSLESYNDIVDALMTHSDNPKCSVVHERLSDGSTIFPKLIVDMEPQDVLGSLLMGGIISQEEMMSAYKSLELSPSIGKLSERSHTSGLFMN